jgi:uncharacterized membrane protein YeaQ/YmgE (transglycosylase-associated protein family)
MPMMVGMSLAAVVIIFAVGALAGWLAGQITRGRGFGLATNAGLGILGALVGSLLFSFLGILTFGPIAFVIKATIGAIVVLAIVHWLRSRRAA